MELLVFGHTGASVLFFPARMGRFYDYENWRIIEALRPKIEAGHLQVYCVDSNDNESFYHPNSPPYYRVQRHLQYERYILDEVLPLIQQKNPDSFIIAAGCSLGAYHAINITLRHPGVFKKVVAMSGRYDLTRQTGHYSDLLQGYWDEHVYFNMPIQYLPNLNDQSALNLLRQTVVVSVVGKDDVLLESNITLHHTLAEKGINSNLYLWDHEAHQAKAWRQMVKVYL
jgi:esterase/lipase superfamily enzyme